MRRRCFLITLASAGVLVLGAGWLSSCASDGGPSPGSTGADDGPAITAVSVNTSSDPSTATTAPRTTSSIVPRADGTFMSLTPEQILSATVYVDPAPDLERIVFPLDLSGGLRDQLVSLVNGLRLSGEPDIEVVYRVVLHVELVDGHKFYVIWFKDYPMIFKDLPQGQMAYSETVESAEMAAFLAGYAAPLETVW